MSAGRPRVLVTRSASQASTLADRLRELGAEPVLIPAIETVELQSLAALDRALARIFSFHWLLFTSANAVETFGRRLRHLGLDISFHASAGPPTAAREAPRIAAIGQATSRALEEIGLRANLLPARAVAESLAEALLPHARQPGGLSTRFLLVRAEEAREHLPETLRSAGAEVVIAPAYRTVIPAGSVERIRDLFHVGSVSSAAAPTLAAATFTSSSAVRNLLALLQASDCALPASLVRASIGPITSTTLQEFGFPAHLEAQEATVESLAEGLMHYLRARKPIRSES